jgi:hypothetical protein
MPSASTTSAKTALGQPGDVRCDKFDNSVLCDHLVVRGLKIVCPGCRKEHSLAEIIREARASGSNIDDLLRDIFKDQQFSLASKISHANMLAQQILRPLRQKLRDAPCRFPERTVEKMNQKQGRRLIRIAGGLDIVDIEKAAKMLGGDMCVYPDGHHDYGYAEFDDSTIGRRMKLGNQHKTTDQFILWGTTLYEVALNLDFSRPDTLDAQIVRAASLSMKSAHRVRFQLPRLADFMFALLVERLEDETLDKQETWVDGAALKLVDNDGKERTGQVSHVIDDDLRRNYEDPTAMVVDVNNWDYVKRNFGKHQRGVEEENSELRTIEFGLCPWFVAT